MRNRYTNEFKAKVVLELLREEKTAAQIAAEYGVHPTQLAQWKKTVLDSLPGAFDKGKREVKELEKAHQKEVDELHKEIGHLTVQVNWLKKNLTNSVSSPKRSELVEFGHPDLSVVVQAKLLGINRSTLYYRPKPETTAKVERRQKVLAEYLQHPYYGSRRIAKVLTRKEDQPVNRKAVQAQMRKLGIRAICPKRNLSRKQHQASIFPYLLKDLKPTQANH